MGPAWGQYVGWGQVAQGAVVEGCVECDVGSHPRALCATGEAVSRSSAAGTPNRPDPPYRTPSPARTALDNPATTRSYDIATHSPSSSSGTLPSSTTVFQCALFRW